MTKQHHTTIDAALLATVNLLRGSKPNDRSAVDRHYAVTITMLEQAYAYFSTYVTRDTVQVANDLARQTLDLPPDCDRLIVQDIAATPRPPTRDELRAANGKALDDIAAFASGKLEIHY